MKLKITDMNLDNSTVLVRVDYNVPIKDNKIINDNKIKASLETINYLKEHNAKIILMSHFGKVKTEDDKKNNTLLPVAAHLSTLLNEDVIFYKEDKTKIYKVIKSMKPKQVMVLENTRFEDLNGKLESNCDIQLSMYYAGLADVFINDAFASSHRVHASVCGVAKYLPSALGFNFIKEIENLNKLINDPEKPFTIIMGGAKAESKIPLIKSLIDKCDYLLLSGCIANTFLKSLNINVGFSNVYNEGLENCKELLIKYKDKINLPLDAIVGNKYDNNYSDYKLINEIDDNDVIYDIGPKTITKYKNMILNSKTIFLNGTMGVYEDMKFANGTKETLNNIDTSNAFTVVGGGDSVSAVQLFKYTDKFDYISTGGGATLEYLINKTLPGIDVIKEVENE